MADFYKYHGLGNDYIVIDPNKLNFYLKLNEENIKLICRPIQLIDRGNSVKHY